MDYVRFLAREGRRHTGDSRTAFWILLFDLLSRHRLDNIISLGKDANQGVPLVLVFFLSLEPDLLPSATELVATTVSTFWDC
jgi:hypothetical protein